MKGKSIKTQLIGILLIVNLMMILVLGVSAFGMLQIRDSAMEAMGDAIETVEAETGVSEDVAKFIEPEIEEIDGLASKYMNIGIGITVLGVCFLIGYIFVVRKNIGKDMDALEQFAHELETGNLTARVEYDANRKDEFGRLHKAFFAMITWYDKTIGVVKKGSINIYNNVTAMTKNMDELNENIESVAATAEELSATMEEMAASVTSIMHAVTDIDGASKGVAVRSIEGAETAVQIKDRAYRAKIKMQGEWENLGAVHKEISTAVGDAIQQIQVVKKIESLSDAIMEITSKTTLLSLNASIEAARAGEAGKGFAVVANEIKNLAEQSRQSVTDIQLITKSVTDASEGLSTNAQRLLDFVSNDVQDSFTDFMELAEAYNTDADHFNAMVMDFSAISEELAASIANVTTEMEQIECATAECAQASEDIANKNMNIGEMSHSVRDAILDTNRISGDLEQTVGGFVISE